MTKCEEELLEQALRSARDTRFLKVAAGARHDAAGAFAQAFGDAPAWIVADDRTFAAAGRDVMASFKRTGAAVEGPFIFGPDVYAEHAFVDQLQEGLANASNNAVPLAVGSGTINDLTKLAAHRLGRPYMVAATAASMDGYTAYGASITFRGSKQTFDCPAPRAVLADLDVVARAPEGMNASGYADLLAKSAAGADWIVADALAVEPIDPAAWDLVQRFLPDWTENPTGVAAGDPECLHRLVIGLMMSGFAMQTARSSRPASGADHQFSHLWDMQHHVHNGIAPSHGFKVGVGTLASLALHELLLARYPDRMKLDVDAAVANWPGWEQTEARIEALFASGPRELAEKALEETRAKWPTSEALRDQLERLRDGWPSLRDCLGRQLSAFEDVRGLLAAAGCPTEPEAIGISRERLRLSYEQAYYIRRRFTILDCFARMGAFESALEELFGAGGAWGPKLGGG